MILRDILKELKEIKELLKKQNHDHDDKYNELLIKEKEKSMKVMDYFIDNLLNKNKGG